VHELSIAQSVVEIVERTARENGMDAVSGVALEVGRLSGVDADSLRFAMEAAAPGTMLEGAEVEIELTEGSEMLVRSVSGEGAPERQAPGSRQGLK
jgi:hydrogenase nickel incorporation protein HypA/HybF